MMRAVVPSSMEEEIALAPTAPLAHAAGLGVRRSDVVAVLRWVALAAIGATLVLAPFDALLWRVTYRDVSFTELEVAWVAALVAWAAVLTADRRLPAVPRSVGVGAVAVAVVGLLSAVVAAPGDAASFHLAIRGTGMVLLFLATADLVRTMGLGRWLLVAAVAGATLAAVIALIGMARGTNAGLVGYGRDFTVAGVLRATGPFDYPNTAAMFWKRRSSPDCRSSSEAGMCGSDSPLVSRGSWWRPRSC